MLRELNQFTQKHGNIAFLALLVLLVGPLVFIFGSGGCDQHRGSLTGGDTYGTLGEKVLTSSEFKHHLQAEAMQYYLTTGQLVNLNGIMRRGNAISDNKDRVLFRMRALMFAEEQGFAAVSDTELAKYKAEQKAFKNDKGEFVPDKYNVFVKRFFENQPITVSDFDEMCRENIVIDRLKSMLDVETTNAAALRAQLLASGGEPQYTLKEFTRNTYMNQTVTDEDIKKIYDAQKDTTYRVPDQRKVKLAAFEIASRPEGAKPITDADVKAHYEANKAEYMTEDQVRASHILIAHKGTSGSKVERTEEEAKELAAKVAKEAKAKDADFAALAKKYSDGPSGKNGGDLNFFSANRMVKPFSDAAFKLKLNEISDPVKTDFGYHIIKKTGEKPSEQKPFDSVKSQIHRTLINDADQEIWAKKAQAKYIEDKETKYSVKQATINYMGITKSDSTDPKEVALDKEKAEAIRKDAAKAKDLTAFVKTTREKYPKMDITDGTNENVDVKRKDIAGYIKKGFELKVGEISEIIEEPDAFYIVQKASERNLQPFPEVRDSIIRALKQEFRTDATASAEAKAKEFIAALNAKKVTGQEAVTHFMETAKAKGVTTAETPFIGQDSRSYLSDILGGLYPATIHNGIKMLTADAPYSDVFKDHKHAFAAVLVEFKAAHAPELNDVRAKITSDLKQQMALDAARKAADELRQDLAKALEDGKKPEELKSFRAPRDYPRSQYMPEPEKSAMDLSYRTKVGEVAIKNIPNGAVLVYIEGREKQDINSLKSSFEMRSQRMYSPSSWANWYSYSEVLEERYPFMARPELQELFSAEK